MTCTFWSNEVNALCEDCNETTSALQIDTRFCSGYTDYGANGITITKTGGKIKAIANDTGMEASGDYAVLTGTGGNASFYVSGEFELIIDFYLLTGFDDLFLFGSQSGVGGSYVFGVGFGATTEIKILFGVYGVSETVYLYDVGEIAVDTWHTLKVVRGNTNVIGVELDAVASGDTNTVSRDLFNATSGDISIGNLGDFTVESAPCYIKSLSLDY
jgi:hypothetical protein